MTNNASRSLRTRRRAYMEERGAKILSAIALCGGLVVTIPMGVGEGNRSADQLQSKHLATSYPELRASMSYKIATSPPRGAHNLDGDIQSAQNRIREAPDPRPFLEQLGWLYIAKARASYDEGFYKLAEHTARALEVIDPKAPAAMLLRGHLLIVFHRFGEAEAMARELVKQRTFPFDYGLLGDALMEQGHLPEAVTAYQQMIDLRPDLQSYSRVAHIRWLNGDLEGAIEAARLAASAASPLDRESASWSLTRLAQYQFQSESLGEAKVVCDSLEVLA